MTERQREKQRQRVTDRERRGKVGTEEREKCIHRDRRKSAYFVCVCERERERETETERQTVF